MWKGTDALVSQRTSRRRGTAHGGGFQVRGGKPRHFWYTAASEQDHDKTSQPSPSRTNPSYRDLGEPAKMRRDASTKGRIEFSPWGWVTGWDPLGPKLKDLRPVTIPRRGGGKLAEVKPQSNLVAALCTYLARTAQSGFYLNSGSGVICSRMEELAHDLLSFSTPIIWTRPCL